MFKHQGPATKKTLFQSSSMVEMSRSGPAFPPYDQNDSTLFVNQIFRGKPRDS